MMQLDLFTRKKTPVMASWDCITFHYLDKDGDECFRNYWRENFTAKQWKNLSNYAKSKIRKTV